MIFLSHWLGNKTQAMALLWSYNCIIINSIMPLGWYMGLSISSSSIFVFFLTFLHKERNPVRAGGFQAATFFFMMQATFEMIDAMNAMQPIKKDGRSQKGLSLDKVSCRTSPINSMVILWIGTGGSATSFSSISCCCTDGMCWVILNDADEISITSRFAL